MKISEFIKLRHEQKRLHPPGSIFQAENPVNGEKRAFCAASWLFAEAQGLEKEYPNLPDWEVTKEDFTQEEVDALT